MLKDRFNFVFLLFFFLTLGLGLTAMICGVTVGGPIQDPPENSSGWSGDFTEDWKQFEQLLNEQKYEAASILVEKMLVKARTEDDSAEWARGLIRYTQLRIALHGYETAVRFLRDQPWPDDVMGSSVLNLFYAQSLVTYARSYSWEINQRERMDSKGKVDLKAWTRDQIYEEAQNALEEVWKIRNELGGFPKTHWKEYLTPNTYPDEIRPTLRDSVYYLRVEMLADTNGWRPNQLNEVYRLNLKNLIAGDTGEISLVDPARHPLEKICFILADLESWHAQMEQ